MTTPATVPLVRDGVPCFCLEVRPPQNAEPLFEVLADLVGHLEAIFGQPASWFDRWAAEPLPPTRLVLNYCPDRDLGRDAFTITATATEIVLVGATPAAVGHACCHVLETAFGVRWLWPGDSGRVLPSPTELQAIDWPVGTERHAPAWAWRRLWLGGAFWREDDPTLAELKHADTDLAAMRQLHAWQRRSRLGGLRIADGHRWSQIFPPEVYGPRHPEYFALVGGQRDIAFHDGKHGNQPCTSNPAVVALTAAHLAAQFRAQPELDGYSLAVNDGSGFCECEHCQALDGELAGDAGAETSDFDRQTDETTPGRGGGATRPITDRMLHFANQVAERVATEFPDKLLLFLIYGPYRTPPRTVKLAGNVIAQFCAMSWAHVDPEVQERDLDTLRQLTGYTQRRGIYDYFVNGVNGSLPRGFGRSLATTLQAYKELGCDYFATQAGLDFATQGFLYYFTARLLWDSGADYDAVLDDYCQRGFGAAAEPVRRYLHAYTERWEETQGGKTLGNTCMEENAARLYHAPWRAARRRELTEAAALADDRRIAERIAFLERGLSFLDRLSEAGAAVIAVRDALPEPPAAAIEHLRASRAALFACVDAGEPFVCSKLWFRYQIRIRNGYFGKWADGVLKGPAKDA